MRLRNFFKSAKRKFKEQQLEALIANELVSNTGIKHDDSIHIRLYFSDGFVRSEKIPAYAVGNCIKTKHDLKIQMNFEYTLIKITAAPSMLPAIEAEIDFDGPITGKPNDSITIKFDQINGILEFN